MRSRTIFIKPVGNRCNMRCRYCFEQNDVCDNKKMSLTLEDTISYLDKYKRYDYIFIVFHGGEPLLAGEDYYRQILSYISNVFRGGVYVQIQTNGSLLKNSWITLFKYYRDILSISISIDPIGNKDLRYCGNEKLRNDIIENVSKITSELDNTGVISVMHRYNKNAFIKFIEKISCLNIKNITINKARYSIDSGIDITESEYSRELIRIAQYWIRTKLYRKLHIQPLNALLSKNNKICLFLNDVNKCRNFSVIEPGLQYDHCYHIQNLKSQMDKKCTECSILDFCGGGCLAEKNDDNFCKGRFILYDFISFLSSHYRTDCKK
ncbi:radical SAM protein [Megasphaera elsdenii]|uniref:radical SAM protein n=1 Tax=Megasphaera elsdenii TaxID=907 RepID=UPI003CFF60B2